MKFRFSIRDLLWLVLVVALVFGWWLDHRSLSSYKILRMQEAELRLKAQADKERSLKEQLNNGASSSEEFDRVLKQMLRY